MTSLLVVCTYLLTTVDTLQRVDFLIYDYLLTGQRHTVSQDLVIVAIDDASLQQLGRWPWSRRRHAELLDRLTEMQARAVGFDILFAEPERETADADQVFAAAIRRNGRTILAVAPSNPVGSEAITEVMPLPRLGGHAAGLGHVDIEIDPDGLCRGFYLHAGLGEPHWPALGLAMLQAADVRPRLPAPLGTPAAQGPAAGWVRHGRLFVPFDTHPKAIRTLAYEDVLRGAVPPEQIAGKYVLVGSTATGLGDFIATPVSFDHRRMSGVELNAHILSGLLQGGLARQIGQGAYQGLAIVLTSLCAVLLVSASFPAGLVLFLATIAGVLAFSALLLIGWHLWFPPAAVLFPLMIGFPVWGAWSLLQERKINRSLTVRMQHQALHHAVTDLPNQHMLEARLRELSRPQHGERLAALMVVHIKWADSAGGIVGRSAGDQLLRAIARRLSDAVRSNDLVAHLSGDDFAVLVEQLVDADAAKGISRQLLNALRQPLDLEGSQVSLSPRMGLSLWPKDSADSPTLLSNAYIAMFRARIEQSRETCIYSDEIAREVHARSKLEQALISAMERAEFEVYYQPQVVTADGRIIGVEALLRWHNPELGLVYPGTFIPVAEHSGLIQAIGGWVLRTACLQVQQWHREGLGPLRLAVNLSPLQFADANLVDEVHNALEHSGLNPRNLELEITESAVMANLEQATSMMRQLKEQGVKLAIDDFGTGYSSLSNLRDFPLDRIKIDQSFVREIHTNDEVREITQTIIGMAKRLRLEVIAEGVETESQASFLGQNGCDELQGFFFGHPLPTGEMAELLHARTPRPGESPVGGGVREGP